MSDYMKRLLTQQRNRRKEDAEFKEPMDQAIAEWEEERKRIAELGSALDEVIDERDEYCYPKIAELERMVAILAERVVSHSGEQHVFQSAQACIEWAQAKAKED